MPTNEPRPTKAVRRDEARAKAAQMRKEQERKARRNRIIGIVVIVLAVVALALIVFKIVNTKNENEAANSEVVYGGTSANVIPPLIADVTSPSTAQDNGGIPVSNGGKTVGEAGDGDVNLTIYFDFMCPICGNFEQINGADVATIVAEAGNTVEYHPISFLDANSNGTFYSTRAANAAAIVADKSPEHFADFVSQMYVDQPAEGSSGRTDAEIAKIATDVGVPQDVADTFTDTASGSYETGTADDPTSHDGTWRSFAPWVAAATNQMSLDGLQVSTPTILVNGEKFANWQTPGALLAAVEAAKS